MDVLTIKENYHSSQVNPVLYFYVFRCCMMILPQTRFLLNLSKHLSGLPSCLQSQIHTSPSLQAFYNPRDGPKKWLRHNKTIYPPQAPEEERRPAVSIN